MRRVRENILKKLKARRLKAEISAFCFLLSAFSLLAQPANDNFVNAQAITGAAGSVSGDNLGASLEPGEPLHNCINPDLGGVSVWYQWTAPADGTITFDTLGSGFDTVLAAYTGTAVSNLTSVACDDDAAGNFLSRISFLVTAGTVYHIAVDGFGGSQGNITLNWRSGSGAGLAGGTFQFTQPLYLVSETEGLSPLGPRMSSLTPRITVTRVLGSSGRMLVNYTVAAGIYTNIAITNVFGTNTYSTNMDLTTGMTTFTNIMLTNFNVTLLNQNNEKGFYMYCPEFLGYIDGETNENGTISMGSVTNAFQTNFVCLNQTTSNNSPPTNFVTTQVFCTNIFVTNLVPAAIPFLDFNTFGGQLIFEDYQMSADILINVFPYNPDPLFNRVVVVTLNSVQADPDEATDIAPPQLNPNRSRAVMNVLETGTIPFSCGARDDITFNFVQTSIRVAERIGSETDPADRVATVLVQRTGTNAMASGSVNWRINFTVRGPSTWDFFPLLAGSDYAAPDDRPWFASNTDYTNVTGTLNWGANDFNLKVIEVPINNDSLVEFNEDMIIELFNPPNNEKVGEVDLCNLTILFENQDGAEQPAGAVDRTHNQDGVDASSPPHNLLPGANGTVFAVAVQPDDRTIVAGSFSAYNTTPRNRIARMNFDGQLDTSFNPSSGANDFISSLALQSDGRIILGGAFNSFNGTQRPRIARINSNGSLDNSFNPGFGANATVWATAIQPDGKILIAGEFSTVDVFTRHFVARLNTNGTVDATFDPGTGPNGSIFAMALQPNGAVMIGGEFTSVGGVPRNHVARLNSDGTLDPTFDPASGADDTVYALAVQGPRVFIGGAFNNFNLISRKSIARLNGDGSLDLSFDPGTGANDTVYSIVPQSDGRVFVGGIFTSFNKTRRMGFTRLQPNGPVDTSFMDTAYNQFAGLPKALYNPDVEPNNFVFTSALQSDGDVIIGGGFSRVGGGYTRDDARPRNNVARLIGGSTPGPGNISLASDSYTADENGQTIFITLVRENGLLGPGGVQFTPTTLLPGPGSAVLGTDFTFTPALYGKPFWNTVYWQPITAYALSDGLTGPNNDETDEAGRPQASLLNDVYINLIDNTNIDGNRTLSMELSQPLTADVFFLGGNPAPPLFAVSNPLSVQGENIPLGVALGLANASLIIVDEDAPHGILTFITDNYIVNEDGTNAVIAVIRTNGSAGAVTVQYETSAGSATAGSDYLNRSGTLNFFAGVTSNVFLVPILNDAGVEDDETVNLRLFNVTGGAKFGLTNATLTIIDNDFASGRLNFSVTNYSASEGAGFATITVTRTGGSKNALFVQYASSSGTATPGIDYADVTGTLNWAAADTAPKTFTVPISQDVFVEGNETVNLRLFNPSLSGAVGSRSNAVLTIVDDDFLGVVQFSAAAYSFPENGGFATITIIRTGGSSESIAVNFTTQDFEAVAGFDYSATNGTLNFGPGEVSQTFTVSLFDNPFQDGDRRIAVLLTSSTPTNTLGFPQTIFLTILDDESHNEPAGSPDTTFAGGFNGDVFALALQADGKILAGGDFTFASSTPRNRIARLSTNGSVDGSFLKAFSGANGAVRTLASQSDGRVLIGGFFTQVNGVNLNSIARLNDNGSLDSLFNPGSGADNPIYALAESFDASGRKIVVGGAFVSFNGTLRNHIARINDNGTLDGSFNVGAGADATVYAVAVFPTNSLHAGKVLIGGDFSGVNGVVRHHIARLNTDGSVDLTFDALDGPDDSVRAIAIQGDGRIMIGGLFTSVNGTVLNHIARLNADGSVDSSFTPGLGANDVVQTIAVQGDTRIILGGQFTRASGVMRNRITRLNADGTVDPMINFGAGANSFVAAAVIQPDDKIIIAGGFTEYDGESHPHIVRLYGGAIAGSGTLEFTEADYRVNENGTNATITVRRRGGTSGQTAGESISVDAVTSDGTAIQGVHYVGGTHNLVFPEGEVFQSFLIPIIDDFEINPDRTANLALANISPPGSAALGDQPTATLTIVNDDSSISFSATTFSRIENTGTGVAAVTVLRAGSTNGDASVQFFTTTNGTATAGLDYVAITNVTVVFTNGETLKTVTIPIIDDSLVEGNETVTMELTNAVGALLLTPSVATLIIVDNDSGPGQITFALPAYSVGENGSAAFIGLIRTNGRAGVVTVRFTTRDGTAIAGEDYTGTSGAVTFGDGETNKNIFIPIINDGFVEGNETFTVALTNTTGGATILSPTNVPVTIIDNDVGFSFASPFNVVNEAGSSVTLTVLRLGGSNGVASVRYDSTNVTATAGLDYVGVTNGILSFANGETVKTFTIPIFEDTLVEGDETFNVVLSNPSPGVQLLARTTVVSILDNDAGLGFAPASYTIGEDGTNVVLTVVRTNANTGNVSVSFATTNGTATAGADYSAVGGQITFTNGEAFKTITVPILDDAQVEGDETFFVTLSSPTGGAQLTGPSTAIVTITNNDAGISFSSPTYTVTESGVQARIIVLRTTFTNTAVAVNYSTSDGTATSVQDYTGVSGTLVFTNGVISNSFVVPIIDDTLEEGAETILLSLSSPTGQVSLLNPNAATLTIIDNDGGSILPAGVLLTVESGPVNGAIDPGETVTALFAMRNASGANTTNLVATLLATNGVTSPSGPQVYGALADGGASVSRSFTFTANGTNGSIVAATFQAQDGAMNLGRVTFAFLLGSGTTILTNPLPIIIVDNNRASPYPSSISVTGLVGSVTRVTVTLTNLSHGSPFDIDMLLVGPTGTNTVLMSDAGGGNFITNVTLTFDDAAANSLPAFGLITNGSYKPTNIGLADLFPSPAPPPSWGSTLSVFNGSNPNGLWSLDIVDDLSIKDGSISRGWGLAITTFGFLLSAADLSVTMSAAPNPVVVGSNLTYSIVVTNHGPWTATGLKLTNTMPAGATFVSATPSQGTISTNSGQVVWTIGTLVKDGVATATIVVRPGIGGSANSISSVLAAETDPNLANNVASTITSVSNPTADLALGVVATPDVVFVGANNNLTYAIVVTNLGPATAIGVTVTNTLPPGVLFLSATPAGYTVAGDVVTFPSLGNLPSGAQTAATIVVRPTTAGTLTNTTTAGSSVVDPLRGNNTVSVKTLVELPQITTSRSGNNLVIAWPADADDYTLERATSLTPPVVWTPVTSPSPVRVGNQNMVTLPIGSGNEFFRLRAAGP